MLHVVKAGSALTLTESAFVCVAFSSGTIPLMKDRTERTVSPVQRSDFIIRDCHPG